MSKQRGMPVFVLSMLLMAAVLGSALYDTPAVRGASIGVSADRKADLPGAILDDALTNKRASLAPDPADWWDGSDGADKGQAYLAIKVDYGEDNLTLFATPYATVTITVTGAGGLKATYAGQINQDGWLIADENWVPPWPNILPGDMVTASVPGATRATEVGWLDALVSVEDDTVTGKIYAPWIGNPILNVECFIYLDEAGQGYTVWVNEVSGDGGDYLCDFTGVYDIQPLDNVQVFYHEPPYWVVAVGNSFVTPVMRVNYAEDRVGADYSAGHSFWITVTNGAGTVKATATMSSTFSLDYDEGGGWGMDGFQTQPADWSPEQPDIRPGDRVNFKDDTGYHNVVKVGAMDGDVDVAGDSIAGNVYAPWFTPAVDVECFPRYPSYPFNFIRSSAAPNGSEAYGCSWDKWDITSGDQVSVRYVEPDGDTVITKIPASDAHFNLRTFLGRPYVEGSTSPGAMVWAVVTDSQGDYRDSGSTMADDQGSYFIFDSHGLEKEALPTDWIFGTSSNGLSTAMQVVSIEGTVDASANTIVGTMAGPGAAFPAKGMVRVHTPDDQWIVWDLDINGDGRYALDMSDKHDVRPGDEVQVFYGAWLDNQTGRSYWVQRQGIYLPVVINK